MSSSSKWDEPIINTASTSTPTTTLPTPIRSNNKSKWKAGTSFYLSGSSSPDSLRSHRLPSNRLPINVIDSNTRNGNGIIRGNGIGLTIKQNCLICDEILYFPRDLSLTELKCEICGTFNQMTTSSSKDNKGLVPIDPQIQSTSLATQLSSLSLSSSPTSPQSLPTLVSLISSSFTSLSTISELIPTPTYSTITSFYNHITSSTSDEPMNLVRDNLERIFRSPGPCLLEDEDEIGWMIILLECPLIFGTAFGEDVDGEKEKERNWFLSRYLGLLSNSTNEQKHNLLRYLSNSNYPQESFKLKVELITSFIDLNLVDILTSSSSPSTSTGGDGKEWRIRSASGIGSLLVKVNELRNNPLPGSIFYSTILDLILLQDSEDSEELIHLFELWESGTSLKYSIFHYPHLLSLGIKIKLVKFEAQRRMEEGARKVFRSTYVGVKNEKTYLELNIRRDYLINDSLRSLIENKSNLFKALRIHFVDEVGIDLGGLRKEWLLLLVRKLFDPQFGMFKLNELTQLMWFNPSFINFDSQPQSNHSNQNEYEEGYEQEEEEQNVEQEEEFYLVGLIIGLAIYNGINLDVPLPLAVYKKLRNEPVSLIDLKIFDPDLARGLQALLDYVEPTLITSSREGTQEGGGGGKGSIEEVFCRTFVGEYESWGEMIQVPLVEGGENILVGKENREVYVQLYVEFILTTSISNQFNSFSRGFNQIINGNAFNFLNGIELELLILGNSNDLDLKELERNTTYDGFESDSITIRLFWNVLSNFTPSRQRILLHFITGSDRTPTLGPAELNFNIINLGPLLQEGEERFPKSWTCFNRLGLYEYDNAVMMKKMLEGAMDWSEGFDLH